MQISTTTSTVPTQPVERQPGYTPPTPKPQETAAEQAKDKEVAAAPKVFTPAPPLRPNVQDYVDINRTLIALRKM